MLASNQRLLSMQRKGKIEHLVSKKLYQSLPQNKQITKLEDKVIKRYYNSIPYIWEYKRLNMVKNYER